jgi:hypothetical protein
VSLAAPLLTLVRDPRHKKSQLLQHEDAQAKRQDRCLAPCALGGVAAPLMFLMLFLHPSVLEGSVCVCFLLSV